MKVKVFVCGPFYTKVYLVIDTSINEAVVIDTSLESADVVFDYAKKHEYTITHIINTHGHVDHIADNVKLKKLTGAKIMIHKDDLYLLENPTLTLKKLGIDYETPAVEPDEILTDGQNVKIGNIDFIVIHTPGHTPGGICLYQKEKKTLLCGDTLFAGSIGRTDLPGGDMEVLLKSIKTKLLILPEETIVYPGHGPTTTIKKEKSENIYLQDDFSSNYGLY